MPLLLPPRAAVTVWPTGTVPSYSVECGDGAFDKPIIDSFEQSISTYKPVTEATIRISVDDYGADTLAEAGKMRVGQDVIISRESVVVWRGWVAEIDCDVVAGWITVKCLDPVGHLSRSVLGEGSNTNLLSGSTTAVNVISTPVSGPAGSGVQLQVDDPTNGYGWWFDVETISFGASSDPRTYYSSTWDYIDSALPPGPDAIDGSYGMLQLAMLYDDVDGIDPTWNALQVIQYMESVGALVSWYTDISEDQPRNEWVRIEGPSASPAPDRSGVIRVGRWAPPQNPDGTSGTTAYSSTRLCVDQRWGVGPGGTSAELVATIMQAGFTQLGVSTVAVLVRSGGEVFDDGFYYYASQTPNVGSAVSSYSDSVEWRYRPELDVVEVAPIGTLGEARTSLAFTVDDPDQITRIVGSSAGMARKVIAQGDGGVTRESATADAGGTLPCWVNVIQAPPKTFPVDLSWIASAAATKAARAPSELTVRLPPPPVDGRSGADWLGDLLAGDTAESSVTYGPWDYEDTNRIGVITVKPSAQDTLEATLVRPTS